MLLPRHPALRSPSQKRGAAQKDNDCTQKGREVVCPGGQALFNLCVANMCVLTHLCALLDVLGNDSISKGVKYLLFIQPNGTPRSPRREGEERLSVQNAHVLKVGRLC